MSRDELGRFLPGPAKPAPVICFARDPFAQLDFIRECVHTSTLSCSWCGSQNDLGRLFRYGTEADAIHSQKHWLKGLFCGLDCCCCYHEGYRPH